MEARGWSGVRKGPGAKECGQFLEAKKGQERDSPDASRRTPLCSLLDLDV